MEENLEDFLQKLSTQMGVSLTLIPSGETFRNSLAQGFGYRVVIGNSLKVFRLNFNNKNSVKIENLHSIDYWNGKPEPLLHIDIENYSEKIIPYIADILKNPKLGVVNIKESLNEDNKIVITKGATGETYGKSPLDLEHDTESKLSYEETLKNLRTLVVALAKGISNALIIFGRSGSSKTFVVEKTLRDMGMSDGDGYYQVSGAVSSPEIYKALYNNRNEIVLFDDCDSALSDQNARNLIKTSTDTKKIRKLSYAKTAAWLYDPNNEEVDPEEDGVDKFPKSFNFAGKIIFISNLSLDEIDPDRAIRTRALIINVDPTDDEIFKYMEKIVDKIELPDGLQLSHEDRMRALEIVKKSKRKKDISIRKLVMTMNWLASGIENAEQLAMLYA